MRSSNLATVQHGAHAVLPRDFQRSDVERILTRVAAHIGLTSSLLRTMLLLVQHTRPSDWVSADCDPVCFASQTNIAATLGKTPRAVREDEARLEALGLLWKQTGADGGRGSYGHGALVLGLNFAPLIEMMPMLLDLEDHLASERIAMQVLRRQISAARRFFRKGIERLLELAPTTPALMDLLAANAELPRRYDGLTSSELEELRMTVDNLVEQAERLCDLHENSSGVSDKNFRPHIQDTNEDNFCICNVSNVKKQPDCKQSEPNPQTTPACASVVCIEIKGNLGSSPHKPKTLESFSAGALYHAATDDFRMYLDAFKRDSAIPNEYAFVQAAIAMTKELGINIDAWDQAVETMGDMTAALAVYIIDANRFHPVRPIHKPGGALRALTRRAAQGKFNLDGSLVGILERARSLEKG